MAKALSRTSNYLLAAAIALATLGSNALAQDDPPSRVARLNYIQGNVAMQPAGLGDWAPAIVNHPFSIGDFLYTDQSAQAELHTDVAVFRMGPQTNFGFLNLDDQTVQISLTGGDMYFRVHNLSPDQTFEVDTPNAAVTVLRDGVYRFRVDPSGAMTFVVARQGGAVITGGGQAFTLDAGNSALLGGTDQLSFDVETAPQPDDFDNWCYQRDAHEAHLVSARYLPPTVVGYEDLDDYGGWEQAGQYGPVWYPRQIAVGWAPYHNGHWAWVDPWGWTWVDDQPWGFAPFHYGRWVYVGGRWGWAPGPIAVGYQGPAVRPYYAPALVAWFGGAHFGVGVSFGSAPTVGWVSLGWGEVYTPSYVCSQRYFTNVNVSNTRIVNTVNITNVYKTVYVNKTVYNQTFVNVQAPGAVMAMKQTEFAGGVSVRQAAVAVPAANVAQLRQGAVMAPPVAPTRQAVAPSLGRPVPHPPAQFAQHQVVAKATPPPAPAPFAARQQYLQQHAGQPANYAAMRQSVAPVAKPAVAIRQVRATPAPVQVHPGQKAGNPAVLQKIATSFPAAHTGAQPSAPHAAPTPAAVPARTTPAPTPAAAGNAPAPRPAGASERTPPNAPRNENATPAVKPGERPQPPPAANPSTRPEPVPANRPAERTPPAPAANSAAPALPAPANRPPERTQPAPARVPATPAPEDRRLAPSTSEKAAPVRPEPATNPATRPAAPPVHPAATAHPETGTHPPAATRTAPPAAHTQPSPPPKQQEKKEEKKRDTSTEH